MPQGQVFQLALSCVAGSVELIELLPFPPARLRKPSRAQECVLVPDLLQLATPVSRVYFEMHRWLMRLLDIFHNSVRNRLLHAVAYARHVHTLGHLG